MAGGGDETHLNRKLLFQDICRKTPILANSDGSVPSYRLYPGTEPLSNNIMFIPSRMRPSMNRVICCHKFDRSYITSYYAIGYSVITNYITSIAFIITYGD